MAQHTETSELATAEAPSGYLVVIEAGPESFGAYVPDLPGCIAVGETAEEVTQLVREAIELHLEAMRESGDPIPPPTSTAIVVRVPAA